MKLIITATELEMEFKRLLKEYKKYYWATAWAGASPILFRDLKSRQDRIEKIIVGTHFYQTHPDFIKTFIDSSKVKFIKQPQGTFHPKCYLFYEKDNKWELLTGSANFTNEAFTRNTEATILIKHDDNNAQNILRTCFELIDICWEKATKFTKNEFEKYCIEWKNHRPKINSLSGQYGSGTKQRRTQNKKDSIRTMTWQEYIIKVKDKIKQRPFNRIKVLEIAKGLFEKHSHFKSLEKNERKFIAGLPNNHTDLYEADWRSFGTMGGSGIFHGKINKNNINISNALDQIPLQGQITKTDYDKYIKYFTKTFPGNFIGTSSRLLAMKRPDIFVCLNNKNKVKLCEAFGITQSEITYEKYWTDIIEKIFDSEWWLNPNPKGNQEQEISKSRAAFLDVLYYRP